MTDYVLVPKVPSEDVLDAIERTYFWFTCGRTARYKKVLAAIAETDSPPTDYTCTAHQCRRQAMEMQAEIERLRKDAERLDWLARQMRMADLWNILHVSHMIPDPENPTELRIAIDAAMGGCGG